MRDSMNGLWTMINDSKMEKMMFATGHIYRETGTASNYVEDRSYSLEMQEEARKKTVALQIKYKKKSF